MAVRRSDREVAEQIVHDVNDHGTGSASEIADSVGISLSRFYAVMVREVNQAAERLHPGHRVMPRSGKDNGYALVRQYRGCDPRTVLRRARQGAAKDHRIALELNVADAGPEQSRLIAEAQAKAVQSDLFVARVENWVAMGEPGYPE